MANTNNQSAVTLVVAGHKVEINRATAVRRLISTPTEHLLIVLDERNKPWTYSLDFKEFEKAWIEEYDRQDDADEHLVDIAEAIFQAVCEGEAFKVLSKHAGEDVVIS